MPQDIVAQFDRKYAAPIETYRLVSTINDRDNIPTLIRWEGMQCYVVSEATTYELQGGITNSDWATPGGVPDAPADNGLYGRRNNAWQIISSSSSVLRKSLGADALSPAGPPASLQDETFGTSEIAIGDVVEYFYNFETFGSNQTIRLRVGSFTSTGLTSLPVGMNTFKGTITFTAIGATGGARVSWQILEANGNFINISTEDSGVIDLSVEVLTSLQAGGTVAGDITLKSGTIKLFKL